MLKVAVVLAAAALATGAQASRYLTAAEREGAGRPVFVTLPQDGLVAQAPVSGANVGAAAAASAGLIGAAVGGLVQGFMDAAEARKAQRIAAPVREALAGVDDDALALAAATNALAGAPWFGTPPQAATTDLGGQNGQLEMLKTLPGGKFAMVTYAYTMTADFREMLVAAEVRLVERIKLTVTERHQRMPEVRTAYRDLVLSRIALPDAGDDREANAARWATDGGALARGALAQGFAATTRLLPRALALTDAEAKALRAGPAERELAGVRHDVVAEDADGAVLFRDHLVHVATAASAPR